MARRKIKKQNEEMTEEEILQIANALYEQAVLSNSLFSMYIQGNEKFAEKCKTIDCFPTFYNLTMTALVNTCFMEVAKMYDEGPNTLSELIEICMENVSVFPDRMETHRREPDKKVHAEISYQYLLSPEERELLERIEEKKPRESKATDYSFGEILDFYKKRLAELNGIRKNLHKQRNKKYAHNDHLVISSGRPAEISNPISVEDMRKLITCALDITKMILKALTGSSYPDEYSIEDEFSSLLDCAERYINIYGMEDW